VAHNTRPILVDVNGKPIPQYFDPLADEYKPLLGQHGAARSILYGPDGQPIGTQTNPLDVRVRELEAKLDELKQTIESGVQLKGSVAQVLDDERAAGFGGRRYYGQRSFGALEGAGAVPIVGKTVMIWFHNLSSHSSRNGVKLHWFLGGTVHDGIPVMDFGDVPAGSVLGIRIGGSAPDNAQITHVPRFGGDGVVFSVDFASGTTGTVRTVILEESSYA